VVFTGHETKLMMNSTVTPLKWTKVQHLVNGQIIFLFCCLVVIAFCGALGQLYVEMNSKFNPGIMLTKSQNPWWPDFPKNILTYIILFNNLIPLSLIVTVEFVKLVLGRLINEDLDMYYTENETPATARTSSLVEELGQIDFIFSDKTGTLTRNIMEFKMSSIGGTGYTEDLTMTSSDGKPTVFHYLKQGFLPFEQLKRDETNGENSKYIQEFLTLLAVCHTVIPEVDEKTGEIIYQASSPDEAALVNGAKSLGYVFHTRKPRSVTINVNGVDQEYEILAVNEFNSTRKRMSVVVKTPDNQVKVMIKGADTVIFERMKGDSPYHQSTLDHLEQYALIGLRTLVLAYRDVPDQEYRRWKLAYDTALATVNNRQQALDDAAEMIEKDLELLGATAIEDKLQEGVPDTIFTLMEAGIKVWVLTGDRQETAINIGMSCKLIKPEMTQIICNEPTKEATLRFLQDNLNLLRKQIGSQNLKTTFWDRFWRGMKNQNANYNKDVGAGLHPLALIIDGKTLDFALEDDVHCVFLELAMLCRAVICCRVSPLQKALVVKLVKDNVAGAVTLAIGDGANDVSMIQAAHVGVGISGQEGLQAARSADFAIAQFRFLRKLLLVHGGWAYSRITKVIAISFYKNITLYLIQFWFAMNNNFSAMTLFETWSSVSSYNVLWTLLPPIAIGVFDQYVSARTLDKYPEMYRVGQNDYFYNHKVFIGFFINSIIHSVLLFWLWAHILGSGDILVDGLVADNWVFGTMVYFTTLVTVSIKFLLFTTHFVLWITVAIFGSLLGFMALFPLVNFVNFSMLQSAHSLVCLWNYTT
jgi:phospholipid-transporting ATPase